MKKITPALVRAALPKRDPRTQKWDYGHSLVIAGSRRLLGAAVLTTKAALRGGAGLVTLATPRSLQTLVYSQVLEALTLPLEETPEGAVDIEALNTVTAYIKDRGVTALTVGPGLTRQAGPFICELVRRVDLPMILDADAINAGPPLESDFFRCLTPHRREFARLIGTSEEEVIKNGDQLASRFALDHPHVLLVLKGHRTRIFWGKEAWENPTGNPGMAKGGSGDVLSGLMGAFMAQQAARPKPAPRAYFQSAAAAVYLHGLAGDLAARQLTETAMNAEDIVSFLPQATRKGSSLKL